MSAGRSCGDCRACCVSMVIPEYPPAGKPAGVSCAHVCATGCSAFGRRGEVVGAKMAKVCDGFACGWLLGFGADIDRPDLSGVIAVQTDAGRAIFEVEPGSLDTVSAKDLIRRLRSDGALLGVNYLDGRRAVYPARGTVVNHLVGRPQMDKR